MSTVINCPASDTYHVFLTEMLTNTTIAEITNEIKADVDQPGVGQTDETRDWIRRITVSDVRVSLVRQSYEDFEPLYRDSLIVVARNETSRATGE